MPYVVVGVKGGGGGGVGGGGDVKVLGVKEGEVLAADCGAVGYVEVDGTTGEGLDVAVKALVLAIQQAQERQQLHHHAYSESD